MQVEFPDILKKNRDAWSFSEEEPWKPVANENAPDEVKKAVSDFVAEVNGDPAPVAKTFNDIINIKKHNPYHDELGRFASANGYSAAGIGPNGVTTEEQDKAYMAAVEAGDMETAQRMVLDTALAVGAETFANPDTTAYSIRRGPDPEETVLVYKTFFVDEAGNPSALFVEGTNPLPVGVWLDAKDAYHFQADNGKMYTPSRKNPNSDGSGKTGASIKIPNDQVRQELIDQGFLPEGSTATSVTALAYRPGWHAGDLPFFPQGGKQGNPKYNENGTQNKRYDPSKPETNYANIHRRNQVVFECEMAADIDYTNASSVKTGANKGKVKYTDMQTMPTDGYYKYATNPMTNANDLGSWYISGSLKINRALSQKECDDILSKNGFKPQEWEGGTMSLDKLNYNPNKTSVGTKLLDPVTYDNKGNVIPLSQRFDSNSTDVRKTDDENVCTIMKTDEDKRLVFGWASIALTVDGVQLEDRQQDMIDPEDLEEAAYEYVLNFRDTGEEHIPTMRKKGKLVESCVLTAEKQRAMGIPEGIVPVGWWIGFKIDDDDAWNRVKIGHYKMFSIEGNANRIPVEKNNDSYKAQRSLAKGDTAMDRYDVIEEVKVAKTFDEIIEVCKYNDKHDKLGRFAPKGFSGGTVVPFKGKAVITAQKISEENVNKNVNKVRKEATNSYSAFQKEEADLESVKKRGGCTDEEAKTCVELADAVFKGASTQEPQITEDIVGAVADNNGKMYGLDFRMKQPSSMAGKIAADAKEKGWTFEEAAAGIKDTIRYTAIFDDDGYVSGYNNVKSALEQKGYTEVRCKNFFKMYNNGTSCQKAVQCVYQNKEGQTFELQFHTYSTQGAKNVCHPLYEEQRAVTTKASRAKVLNTAMTKLHSYSAVPDGVLDIQEH